MKALNNILVLVVLMSFTVLAAAADAGQVDVGQIWGVIVMLKEIPLKLSIPFYLAAFAGLLFHFAIDVKKGLIAGGWGGFVSYIFVNKVATVTTVLVILTGGVTWFAINPAPNYLQMLIAAATLGYTSDSVFNKAVK